MSKERRFEHLLSPYRIGNVEFKNRYLLGPMGIGQNYTAQKVMSPEALDFYTERAKGGFGAIILGAQQADNEVDMEVGASPLGFKSDYMLWRKQINELMDRVNAYGCKLIAQISAGMGRNYPGFKAPSAVEVFGMPDTLSPEMTKEEIRKKIDAVVHLAKLEKLIGVPAVEVHAMHWGYLLDQFSMSLTNHRTDEYGGSLENRMRMAKEIVEGIKQECGTDYPVLMKMGLKSYMKGLNKASFDGSDEAGRTLEEGIQIAKLLEAYGYDAIDLDMGTYESFYYACPPSYIPQGFAIDMYGEVKKAVSIPVIAGARMQDPFLGEQAIKDGKCDAVVLARPALADPDIPRKVSMGEPEKIRPCIACLQCFARTLDDDRNIICSVNPELYKEGRKMGKALVSKKVMVVGGGAGGLEAARRAKLAGHDVELYEKTDRLGGQMIAAGAQKMKKEIRQLVEWYKRELDDLNIPVHLNTEVSTEMIKEEAPDAVILAEGAEPVRMRFIPGTDKPHVVDCLTALADMTADDLGKKIVVVGGGHVGCEVATEMALNRGKDVEIVEMLDDLMSGLPVPSPIKNCLKDMCDYYDNIHVHTGTALQEVLDDGVMVKDKNGTHKIPCDNVILAVGFKASPMDVHELEECGIDIYSIGNGHASANIHESTLNAYQIVKGL